MCAYAEVARNHPGSEPLIVSLGTGRPTGSISYREAKDWGLVQWAHPLLGVIMDGASVAIDYQLNELLGPDRGHFRFQSLLEGVSDSLDDASPANIEGLCQLAQPIHREQRRQARARLRAADSIRRRRELAGSRLAGRGSAPARCAQTAWRARSALRARVPTGSTLTCRPQGEVAEWLKALAC